MPRNRIRELREEQGLSQVALAKKLGVSRWTVKRWEEGEAQVPERRRIDLADVFAVSISFLMGYDRPNGNGKSKGRKAS